MALKKAGVELVAENAREYLTSLQRGEQATQNFITGLGGVVGASGKMDASMLKLANRAASLNDTLGIQKRQLGVLETELEQVTKQYGAGSTQAQKKKLAIDRLNTSINKNERELNAVHKELQEGATRSRRYEDAMRGAFERVGHKITDFAVNAGQQLASFVGNSIGVAGDYEANLNRFASVTGSSMQEAGLDVADFSKLFLQMGADTQYSAGQAADAAIELAKGGLDPATISGGALADTLSLASAGELELGKAAEITAKQLGVWESEGVKSAEVANLMAQAANASTVGVEDLAVGMANVGGVAKVAGLSFEETVTALAQIAPGFSSASDAGTSFKAFLNNLQPTTKPATEAMISLGLYTAEAGSAFYDAQGNFIGFEKAAEKLYQATKDLSEAERALALETIFGSDAQRAAALIAEKGAEGYRQMAKDMGKAGSATEQATEKNKGFNFAMESMKGSLETFQIVAGEKVLPILTDLVGVITSVINVVTDAVGAIDDLTPLFVGLGSVLGIIAATQLPRAILGFKNLASEFLSTNKGAILATTALTGIGAVITLYTSYVAAHNTKVAEGVRKQLDLNVAWNQGREALEKYQALDVGQKQTFRGQADEVDRLQKKLEELRGVLAAAKAADTWKGPQFLGPEEQALIQGAIEENERQLLALSGALEKNVDSSQRAKASFDEMPPSLAQVISDARATRVAMGEVNTEFRATPAQIEEAKKALVSVMEEGQKAIKTLLETQVAFQMEAEARRAEHHGKLRFLQEAYDNAQTESERQAIADQMAAENTAYLQSEQAQAANHAKMAAAQQAHLGQMLIDWVNAQMTIGKLTTEQAGALNTEIAKQYGVMADNTSLLFGQMTGSILDWSKNGTVSASDFVRSLMGVQDASVETRKRQEELGNQLASEITAEFNAGRMSAEAYDRALRGIPARVNTMLEIEQRIKKIETTYYERKEAQMDQQGYAKGAKSYPGGLGLFGEEGPEAAINPRTNQAAILSYGLHNVPRGFEIVPADKTRGLLEGKRLREARELMMTGAAEGSAAPQQEMGRIRGPLTGGRSREGDAFREQLLEREREQTMIARSREKQLLREMEMLQTQITRERDLLRTVEVRGEAQLREATIKLSALEKQLVRGQEQLALEREQLIVAQNRQKDLTRQLDQQRTTHASALLQERAQARLFSTPPAAPPVMRPQPQRASPRVVPPQVASPQVSHQMIRPVASAQQIAQTVAQQTTYAPQYHYAPTYASQPRQPSTDFAFMRARARLGG